MKRPLWIAMTSLAFAALAGAADTPSRPAPTTLAAPKSPSLRVDARGFIHRWRVLEPIAVPGRLTEPAVQEALQSALRVLRRLER